MCSCIICAIVIDNSVQMSIACACANRLHAETRSHLVRQVGGKAVLLEYNALSLLYLFSFGGCKLCWLEIFDSNSEMLYVFT